jgi:hypothetical protein
MKRMTLLALLASVAFAAPAFAQCNTIQCDPPELEPDPICVTHPRDPKKVACVYEDDMSNSERLDVYNILAGIERRVEAKAKAAAAAEEARLSQCKVRWLGIGCPPKK